MEKVLTFLPLNELYENVQYVNTVFYRQVSSPTLWKCVESMEVVYDTLIYFIGRKFGSYIEKIDLKSKDSVSNKAWLYLFSKVMNLKYVDVSGNFEIDDRVVEYLVAIDSIEYLGIQRCGNIYNIGQLNTLKHLKVLKIGYNRQWVNVDAIVWNMLQPSLIELSANGLFIDDARLVQIGKRCPLLEKLDMYSEHISSKGLEQFVQYCPLLKHLHFVHNPIRLNISNAVLHGLVDHCPLLVEIK